MADEQQSGPDTTVTGHAYGVGLVIEAPDAQLLGRMLELLPPGFQQRQQGEGATRFGLTTEDGVSYSVERDGSELMTGELDVALGIFDTFVRGHVALNARDRVFVHAGAVAYRGTAILIPGMSFTGKTTLVAELVSAGAVYYSDEFAVLDQDGRVHPYAKPLSLRLREGEREQTNQQITELGGVAGHEPVPVGLIACLQYRAGSEWQPTELTPGEAVLELFSHAVPASTRPQESLLALRRAAQHATALKGTRGEAAAIVPDLLQRVQAAAASRHAT